MLQHWKTEVEKYRSDEKRINDNAYDYSYVVRNVKITETEVVKLEAKLSPLEWTLKQILG